MLQLTVSAPEETGGGEHKVVLVATVTSSGKGEKGVPQGAQPSVPVRFYRQGREIGQEVTEGDGRAVLEVTGLTPGTHLFEAQTDGPLVKSSKSVSIPKPASRPAKIVKDLVVYAPGKDGKYIVTVSCKDAEGNPLAGVQGRVFGLDSDPCVATLFTTTAAGMEGDPLRVTFDEPVRELIVQAGGLQEDLTLLGPFKIKTNKTNNRVCLGLWALAIVWLVVNVILVFVDFSSETEAERFRRSVLEEGGRFSFSIPPHWGLWAGWMIVCLISTPIALRDEAVWAFQVAKRKLIEDRGGKETAPTPKATSSSATTTTTANRSEAGGENHLTWRSYIKWEFIIALLSIFFEKIVSGALEKGRKSS